MPRPFRECGGGNSGGGGRHDQFGAGDAVDPFVNLALHVGALEHALLRVGRPRPARRRGRQRWRCAPFAAAGVVDQPVAFRALRDWSRCARARPRNGLPSRRKARPRWPARAKTIAQALPTRPAPDDGDLVRHVELLRGRPSAAMLLKAASERSMSLLREVVDDEDDVRAAVVARPGGEVDRRVDHVLHAVDGPPAHPRPATLRMPFTRSTLSPWVCSSMVSQMPKAVQSSAPSKLSVKE